VPVPLNARLGKFERGTQLPGNTRLPIAGGDGHARLFSLTLIFR
jgi:hypothetical protein